MFCILEDHHVTLLKTKEVVLYLVHKIYFNGLLITVSHTVVHAMVVHALSTNCLSSRFTYRQSCASSSSSWQHYHKLWPVNDCSCFCMSTIPLEFCNGVNSCLGSSHALCISSNPVNVQVHMQQVSLETINKFWRPVTLQLLSGHTQ